MTGVYEYAKFCILAFAFIIAWFLFTIACICLLCYGIWVSFLRNRMVLDDRTEGTKVELQQIPRSLQLHVQPQRHPCPHYPSIESPMDEEGKKLPIIWTLPNTL